MLLLAPDGEHNRVTAAREIRGNAAAVTCIFSYPPEEKNEKENAECHAPRLTCTYCTEYNVVLHEISVIITSCICVAIGDAPLLVVVEIARSMESGYYKN